MNIISEKESGVALVNEILPMTSRQYVVQKIFIGFVFGCLSAIVTAAICFLLSPAKISSDSEKQSTLIHLLPYPVQCNF